jgi:hypothetical protein
LTDDDGALAAGPPDLGGVATTFDRDCRAAADGAAFRDTRFTGVDFTGAVFRDRDRPGQ